MGIPFLDMLPQGGIGALANFIPGPPGTGLVVSNLLRVFGPKLFGGKDRNVTLSGVDVGDTSKYPSLIQQQIGLVPKETYTKSKFRHLGPVLNRNIQQLDRVTNRTLGRFQSLAEVFPELKDPMKDLIRARNVMTSQNFGSPEGAGKVLQDVFNNTVRAEKVIDDFSKFATTNEEIQNRFRNEYGVEIGDFFKEFTRRTEHDIAKSQIPLLQPIAADPNNPMQGKAKADLARMREKLKATGTPIIDLQRILPKAQSGEMSTYKEPAPKKKSPVGVDDVLNLAKNLLNPKQPNLAYVQFQSPQFSIDTQLDAFRGTQRPKGFAIGKQGRSLAGGEPVLSQEDLQNLA